MTATATHHFTASSAVSRSGAENSRGRRGLGNWIEAWEKHGRRWSSAGQRRAVCAQAASQIERAHAVSDWVLLTRTAKDKAGAAHI